MTTILLLKPLSLRWALWPLGLLLSLWAWIFKFGIQLKHLGSNCLTENPASTCQIFLYLSLFSSAVQRKVELLSSPGCRLCLRRRHTTKTLILAITYSFLYRFCSYIHTMFLRTTSFHWYMPLWPWPSDDLEIGQCFIEKTLILALTFPFVDRSSSYLHRQASVVTSSAVLLFLSIIEFQINMV